MNRYVIDHRVGIIAIRDSKHPKFESSNGLSAQTPDVVYYIYGEQLEDGWFIEPEDIKYIEKLCKSYNNKFREEKLKRVLYDKGL